MKALFFILLISSTIYGCSSKPVLPVAEPNPPVAAVQQDITAHRDHPITWGGVILETNNTKNQSEVLIITKRLTSSTRPIESDQTLGRFIAIDYSFFIVRDQRIAVKMHATQEWGPTGYGFWPSSHFEVRAHE